METVEILRKAKAVLEERGWFQLGNEARPGGPCCAMGAVRVAATGSPVEENPGADEARGLLVRAVGESIVAWNDTPGRTKEEVLAAFDRAIALASPGSQPPGSKEGE